MQIQRIEISKLTGDPANARKHGDRNIQTIVESLNRFGQQKPIVVDSSNCVRAGNGTLEAARSLGWTHLDCVVTDLKGLDAIAYAIADNRTAELAEWDMEILAAELESLQSDGLLQAAGFTDEELSSMLPDESETELKEIKVQDPPRMSWVLLGIQTVRFGEIANEIERLAKIVDICETTCNDG